MDDKPILDFVLTQLDSRKGRRTGNLVDIARETELDYSWLSKLAQRRIPDPSVNKIQKLADYFRRV